MLIGTEDGLYLLRGDAVERLCCGGMEVMDAAEAGGELYICAMEGLFRLGARPERLAEGSCWRLWSHGGELVASMEGPRLYAVSRGSVKPLADYREVARERGWWAPVAPPRITDFAVFRGQVVGSVEVGHLMAGPDPASLEPLDFEEDQHNLLAVGGRLLVATASGVYHSEDLVGFRLAEGSRGYFHALARCGELVAGHVMSATPLRVSGDGVVWRGLPLRLPSPTYGTTGLACGEGQAIYSTTAVYRLDLAGGQAHRLAEVPMTRRVVGAGAAERPPVR